MSNSNRKHKKAYIVDIYKDNGIKIYRLHGGVYIAYNNYLRLTIIIVIIIRYVLRSILLAL